MRRDEMMQEIASLDDQINTQLAGAKLPSLDKPSFPLGTWLIAAVFYGLSLYGALLPEVGPQMKEYSVYFFWGAVIIAVFALLGTFSWMIKMFRTENTESYRAATAQVKVLQDRRQELVLRVKELDQA